MIAHAAVLFSESRTPLAGWVLRELRASGSSAPYIYIYWTQKSISLFLSRAQPAALCCWECMRVCFVLGLARVRERETIYIWKRRRQAGSERCLCQRLSFLVVLIVRVRSSYVVFVCCHRAYLVQGENIRVRALQITLCLYTFQHLMPQTRNTQFFKKKFYKKWII